MLRFGPERGPVVVVAQPLFEEANRTRPLLVDVLRRLAAAELASVLPDLPGQGESIVPTVDARLNHWRQAFAAACVTAGSACFVVAIRGGALVDGHAIARGRYHLSPEPGARLVRDLFRARRAAALASNEPVLADDVDQPGPPLTLVGNLLDRELLRALISDGPTQADQVRTIFPDPGTTGLSPPDNGDPEGRPRFVRPWAAAEAHVDPGLAQALATDVAGWVRTCEGC